MRERKVFIAEEKGFTLARSQFYYRNNVKAASFEAARSEIALTSKLRIFITATFLVCMYAWCAWKRVRAYMRTLADADLIRAFYVMSSFEKPGIMMINRGGNVKNS